MSYFFYKWLHLSSLLLSMIFTGILLAQAHGMSLPKGPRVRVSALQGTFLLIAFVAGFGLMARGSHSFNDGWVWFKLFAWLLFGMSPLFVKKLPSGIKKALPLFYGGLLFLTVHVVLTKPF